MDIERSTNDSSVKQWSSPPVVLPEGTDGDLLRLGPAAGHALLYVVCGSINESVAHVQSGDFSVAAVRRSGSPLSMVNCVVGEHQWPLAGDSPALRVGPRKFSFAFPGFFYGLALPEGCSDEEVARLETILRTFCIYENHAGEEDYDFCDRSPETEFWSAAYPKMRMLSFRSPPPGTPLPEPWTREETTAKLQRALRTSAAAKLLAKVLLRDAVDPTLHVVVTRPVAAAPASSGGGPHVLASLRAVSDVVDAVEAARGIDVGGWSMAPDRWAAPPQGTLHWHFNVAGLTLVLRAVAAVAARARADGSVAGRGGRRSSSSLSGQASEASTVENPSLVADAGGSL